MGTLKPFGIAPSTHSLKKYSNLHSLPFAFYSSWCFVWFPGSIYEIFQGSGAFIWNSIIHIWQISHLPVFRFCFYMIFTKTYRHITIWEGLWFWGTAALEVDWRRFLSFSTLFWERDSASFKSHCSVDALLLLNFSKALSKILEKGFVIQKLWNAEVLIPILFSIDIK